MLARPVPSLFAAFVTLAAGSSLAAEKPKPVPHTAKPAGPKAVGKFDDWVAATNGEGGQTICYAFTRAQTSAPALPGRGDVVLTVTHRPGGPRDAIALSAGFAYAPNATVTVAIDQTSTDFYTAQRSAFARDGHAVVAGFQKAHQVVARSPAPHNAIVSDTFSLKGFSAAYAAINKACPAK